MTRETPTVAPLSARVDSFLTSGLGESKPFSETSLFCEEGIGLALEMVDNILPRNSRGNKTFDWAGVRTANLKKNETFVLPVQETEVESGKIVWTGSRETVPHLGVARTIRKIGEPRLMDHHVLSEMRLLPQGERTGLGYHFLTNQFLEIVRVGSLRDDCAKSKILALTFMTMVAKRMTVARVRELIGDLRPYMAGVALESSDSVVTKLDEVEKAVRDIRRGGALINLAIETTNQIAKRANYSPEQKQLILDLALISNHGHTFTPDGEFKKAFEPLVGLVVKDEWLEAGACRDFLLRYFMGVFPVFRRMESFYTGFDRGYNSLHSLVVKTLDGKVRLTADDIPVTYRRIIGDKLMVRLQEHQALGEEDILRSGSGLAYTIVRELSIRMVLANYPANVRREILSVLSNQSYSDTYKHVLLQSKLGRDFDKDILRAMITGPYRLAGYDFAVVRALPADNGQQQKLEVTGGVVRQVDLGDILYYLISDAVSKKQRGALSIEEIREAFLAAHQRENSDPLTRIPFTVSQYLRVLIRASRPKIEPSDPVMRFVDEMEEGK